MGVKQPDGIRALDRRQQRRHCADEGEAEPYAAVASFTDITELPRERSASVTRRG